MRMADMHLEDPLNKLVLLDRLESQNASGGDVLAWNLEAWVGRDLGKLWIRSEGERQSGDTERAELELLYGRGLWRWWELSRERASTSRRRATRAGPPSVCAG